MYNKVSNSLKLSWLHDSDFSLTNVKYLFYKDEKRMPFMNFKIKCTKT